MAIPRRIVLKVRFLFPPVLPFCGPIFCDQGSEIIPPANRKKLTIWSTKLKFNHRAERYDEANKAMEMSVRETPAKRVNGSALTKVIIEKTRADAINSQLDFAGFLPVDLISRYPLKIHSRTNIGMETPGAFSQNSRSKSTPISKDTGRIIFVFIIHLD